MRTFALSLVAFAFVAPLGCSDDAASGPGDEASFETDVSSGGPGDDGDGDGDSDSDGSGEDGDSGDDGPDPACEQSGLDLEGMAWSLPTWPGTERGFDAMAGTGVCDGNVTEPRYVLTDLDGDGRTDLTVTYACEASIGFDQWVVFANTGDGFAAEGSGFSLPTWPGSTRGFQGTADAGLCDDGIVEPRYSLLDLAGDGLPDLVITYACEDAIGFDRWVVFENSGDGFAESATPFMLPRWPGSARGFQNLGEDGSCGDAGIEPRYALVDLTGEGRPDLVVTYACGDAGIGSDHWIVFENHGDGFDPDGVSFALPPAWPGSDRSFESIAHGGACDGVANPRYQLLDLTGDRRPDLVVTYACGDAEIGDEAWILFENEGSGFDTEGAQFALPQWPGSDRGFETVADNGVCDDAIMRPRHSLLDLNADERPDLVVTYACEDTIGFAQWAVFDHVGDGFAPDARPFVLPEWPGSTWGFQSLGDNGVCDQAVANPRYSVLDLDGNTATDIILTYACDQAGIGSERWIAFLGECD